MTRERLDGISQVLTVNQACSTLVVKIVQEIRSLSGVHTYKLGKKMVKFSFFGVHIHPDNK